ncbi:hypothetical protein ACFFT4_27105, partial [Cohnella cellulosilytica]|uniref:hypothetical protein n=1 Tax=Cohnella cellulosilytica TaxID=986710 RepID=UPI0035E969F2
LNTSTPQHLNTSTPQHLNTSTPQHLNTSTPQHLNSSSSLDSSSISPIESLKAPSGPPMFYRVGYRRVKSSIRAADVLQNRLSPRKKRHPGRRCSTESVIAA